MSTRVSSEPDFLCIGAQKAGTGWLYDQLAGHPDFWLPPIKELHYFDDPKRFAQKFTERKLQTERFRARLKGNGRWPPDDRDKMFYKAAREISALSPPSPDAYARLFEPKLAQLSGDMTPAYSTLDQTIVSDIAARFPNLKIVLLVREPIDRFWSQLCMNLRKGELQPIRPDDPSEVIAFAKRPEVVARSFPSVTYGIWSKYFDKEHMGVFFFDDLRQNPVSLRQRIFSFLAPNSPRTSAQDPLLNRKGSAPKVPMADVVKDSLLKYFGDELQRCAQLFRGSAEAWPAQYGL
jgi:hypothetical protein